MIPSSSTNILPELEQTPTRSNGIDLSFTNLRYSIEAEQNQEKVLIHPISGIFKAGQVAAIMGPSGAGKTTLLNLIACRIKLQQGQLLANSMAYGYEQFGDFGNYVMQNDILMGTMTVRQTLEFAANLKLVCSDEQKKMKVEELSRQLKLQRCLDTLIGSPLIKGISGGQKKRTSIAFQMISDPELLILDEPTAGLDSLTSFIIVQYLSNFAKRRNKTVIMTIHQPNSDIYDLFDRLFLMVEGKIVYQGPSSQAVDYFDRNFGLRCPEFYNPADYFIAITHPELQNNVKRYPRYFESYTLSIAPKVEENINSRNSSEIVPRKMEVGICTTYKQLISRNWKNMTRQPLMTQQRVFQTIVMFIYLGGLYFRSISNSHNTQKGWEGLKGFFYFISLDTFMTSMVPSALTFPNQRQIFLKEENSRLYSTTAYFLSRNIVELPYGVIFPLIEILIVYWFAGLSSTATQFFICLLVLYLLSFNGMSFGMFFGSIIEDQRSVSQLIPIISLVISLVSGYYKNLANLPAWMGWVQYLSPLRYSFEAFVRNETQFSTSLIDQLNFNLSIWFAVGLFVALGLLFRILGLFFLWLLRSRLQ